MLHRLSFDKLVSYDPSEPGITLEIGIKLGKSLVEIEAKVDTGSTFCVFERNVGESFRKAKHEAGRYMSTTRIVAAVLAGGILLVTHAHS